MIIIEQIIFSNKERTESRSAHGGAKIYALIRSGKIEYQKKRLFYCIKLPYFEGEAFSEQNIFFDSLFQRLFSYLQNRIKDSESRNEYAFADFSFSGSEFDFSFFCGKFEDRNEKKHFIIGIDKQGLFSSYKKLKS